MAKKNQQRGRDIAAPITTIELNGQSYQLAFNNECFRLAEDVYADHYKRPEKSFTEIVQDLANNKYGALMAVLYGALLAGGSEMEWEDFDRAFTLASLPAIREKLMEGVTAALPEADTDADEGNL